jgi:hypothetical protein
MTTRLAGDIFSRALVPEDDEGSVLLGYFPVLGDITKSTKNPKNTPEARLTGGAAGVAEFAGFKPLQKRETTAVSPFGGAKPSGYPTAK